MFIPILNGRITATFREPRPISNPGQHIHGAIDVAGGDGTVLAPEDGELTAYVFLRAPGGAWAHAEKTAIMDAPPHDYWYDIYGGVVGITGVSGRYHILAHFWPATLQERFGKFSYTESKATTRWPSIMLATETVSIKRGDKIAKIGNAGYSFGAHVHWEVHHSATLETYHKRIDPATLVE